MFKSRYLEEHSATGALASWTLMQMLFFLNTIGMGFVAVQLIDLLAAVLPQDQQLVILSSMSWALPRDDNSSWSPIHWSKISWLIIQSILPLTVDSPKTFVEDGASLVFQTSVAVILMTTQSIWSGPMLSGTMVSWIALTDQSASNLDVGIFLLEAFADGISIDQSTELVLPVFHISHQSLGLLLFSPDLELHLL
jgi:hypothetical protein